LALVDGGWLHASDRWSDLDAAWRTADPEPATLFIRRFRPAPTQDLTDLWSTAQPGSTAVSGHTLRQVKQAVRNHPGRP
jgi:hypothetical protein